MSRGGFEGRGERSGATSVGFILISFFLLNGKLREVKTNLVADGAGGHRHVARSYRVCLPLFSIGVLFWWVGERVER